MTKSNKGADPKECEEACRDLAMAGIRWDLPWGEREEIYRKREAARKEREEKGRLDQWLKQIATEDPAILFPRLLTDK